MKVIFVIIGVCGMNGIFEINVIGYFVSCFALEIGSGFEFVVH